MRTTTMIRAAALALLMAGCRQHHTRRVPRPPAPPPTPIALDDEPPPRPAPTPPPAPEPPPRPLPAPRKPVADPGTATCGPGPGERYSVHGVDASDTLNVRAEPDARGEVIGQLPPDTVGVIDLGERRRSGASVWRKVRCHKLEGWVNDRFLMHGR